MKKTFQTYFRFHFALITPELTEDIVTRALVNFSVVNNENFGSFLKLVFLYSRVVIFIVTYRLIICLYSCTC